MMRLRASLLLLLLACTPVAWADTIKVTTVVDEDNVADQKAGHPSVDHGCSLREAVRFMDGSAAERMNGYGGCKLEGDATVSSTVGDTINLPKASLLDSSQTVYQLTRGEIPVTTSVNITGANLASIAATDINDFPQIRAQALHRIFSVANRSSVPVNSGPGSTGGTAGGAVTSLSLSSLVLTGCGSNCADKGGIITVASSASFSVNNVRLSAGVVSAFGGAIYMSPNSALTVQGSSFEGNIASSGAAIAIGVAGVSPSNNVSIGGSLFTGNVATAVGLNPGAVISLAEPFPNSAYATLGGRNIISSTISGNIGVAIRAQGSATLRNLTIVENSAGGIDFGGSDTVQLHDSIVAGNPDNQAMANVPASTPPNDCINLPGVPTDGYVSYNLFSSANCNGLGTPYTTIANSGNDLLIAHVDASGACLAVGYDMPTPLPTPPASATPIVSSSPGLLCPLASTDPNVLKFHKPRLIALYPTTTLSADLQLNHIVNTGAPAGNTAVCATADQRSRPQRSNSCDLGAIAVQADQVVNLALKTIIGKPVTGDIISLLGDTDLLPGFACAQVAASRNDDGCYKVQQDPTKGTYSVDKITHKVTYTPRIDYYGEDRFSFLVATTLSRFSDPSADPEQGQFVQVNVTVQTEPSTVLENGNTKAGAMDGLELLGLCALFGARTLRRVRNRFARDVI
jgi:CSLREA domain-containing protein